MVDAEEAQDGGVEITHVDAEVQASFRVARKPPWGPKLQPCTFDSRTMVTQCIPALEFHNEALSLRYGPLHTRVRTTRKTTRTQCFDAPVGSWYPTPNRRLPK